MKLLFLRQLFFFILSGGFFSLLLVAVWSDLRWLLSYFSTYIRVEFSHYNKFILQCLKNSSESVLNRLVSVKVLWHFFFFFLPCSAGCSLLLPDRGWNPWPLQWKHGVLTLGPQGSPCEVVIIYLNIIL